MLSRHSCQGSALPPIWNATCWCESSTLDVNTYEKFCGEVLSVTGCEICCVKGESAICTFARTPTALLAVAVNDRVYETPFCRVMSFWPVMASHGFVVPP